MTQDAARFTPHIRTCREGVFAFSPGFDPAGRSMENYGEYGAAGLDLFRQFLRPGAHVVEIGAGFGAWTVPLARMVGPGGRVFAFEPRRALFNQLAGNIALNGLMNVDVIRVVIGEKGRVGKVALWDYGCKAGDEFEQIAEVPCDSLPFNAVHLMVIDCRGEEATALRGAGELLAKHRPVLYVAAGRDGSAAAALMLKMGYRLWRCADPLYRPDNHHANPVDVFAGVRMVHLLGLPPGLEATVSGLQPITDAAWMGA